MRRAPGPWLSLLLVLAGGTAAAYDRTFHFMPTGNGHGFQVFDRQQGRITQYLSHPYRYVAPGDDARTWGVGRRNLAHDIYFGVRAGASASWLTGDFASAGYEDETHVIQAATSLGSVHLDTYYFAPFGYAGNAMLMLIRARNDGASAQAVSFFAKPNLKLGQGRVDPDDLSEQIAWLGTAAIPHGEETGPGGGHAIYVPLGTVDHASCGDDADLYADVLATGVIGDAHTCNGDAQVLVLQHDADLEPGAEAWWGVAVLFVNDNPDDPRAHLFRDPRSVSDILDLWDAFASGQDARALHDAALQEFEAWRSGLAPAELDATERRLWRQSEAVLRMGQVLERDGKNRGMILASLPPGEWHTGWVRDAMYAVAALAMTGHVEEAKAGVEFFIGADAGFFSGSNLLDRDYRVSACRYFGNGMEEGDFNNEGPNVETDGWGLVLWGARLALHYSCDLSWLDTVTWKGDTVFEALHHIVSDIEATMASNLPGPDCSIWETHWNYRQVFGYTAATQIRGLFDFADIADAYGRPDLANHFRGLATDMLATAKSLLVHHPTQSFASHLGVAGSDVHVDGSVVAFLDWDLAEVDDPLFLGTLNSFAKLVTGFGGYRRLEEQLSLTGEGSAGTYDLSEWILLDLRIGDNWRRLGHAARADDLLSKITGSAAANDFLIPELFDKDNGFYTGVVPMVGYGAGAWMMSQLLKYGEPAPRYDAGFDHCSACEPDPCTGEHQECVEDGQGGYTCPCEPGYHDEGGECVPDTVCDAATTCAGHGTCTGVGLECECFEEYTGDHCELCATGYQDEDGDKVCHPGCATAALICGEHSHCEVVSGEAACVCDEGYRDEEGQCVPVEDGEPEWEDGKATLCSSSGKTSASGWALLALLVTGLVFGTRKRTGVLLLLLIPAAATSAETVTHDLNRPAFPEDAVEAPDGWSVSFHGYARMPLRFHGSPVDARPPYLVDDDYYLSGFAYTRVNETEWAELFLGVHHGRTRFAVGLFASEFSDWSETSLSGQSGISTAFVEHTWELADMLDLDVRAGMFWDRQGYVSAYDTYLLGRMHVAGLRLGLRLWDLAYLKLGYGAHADVIKANQGFTPVAWARLGVDLGWLDAAFMAGTTWTRDSEREFSIVEDGSLSVYGGELRAAVPYVGPAFASLAFYQARQVVFLANAFELLHSTGGRGLTQNFFGPDSDNGTGEILSGAIELVWQPHRAVDALFGPDAQRLVSGLEVRMFGMFAWVASNQASTDPAENFHDRVYLKWGIEPLYRPHLDGWSCLFVALRYDRVILDSDHESLSFRALTPRVGVTPIRDPQLDIFLSYTSYSYGENVRLRPNQIPGDVSVTRPDDHAFKLQAQVSW